MNIDKKIFKFIGVILLIDIIILFVDYSNVISSDKFNMYLVSSIILNSVNLSLYIFTYFLLNKRTVTKSENQKTVAEIMLEDSYKSVEEMIEILTPEVTEKFIAPKIDYNDSVMNQPLFLNLVNKPFAHDEQITAFAKEGIINGDQFNHYITIKRKFFSFVNMTVTFFDKKEIPEKFKRELVEEIKKSRGGNK